MILHLFLFDGDSYFPFKIVIIGISRENFDIGERIVFFIAACTNTAIQYIFVKFVYLGIVTSVKFKAHS